MKWQDEPDELVEAEADDEPLEIDAGMLAGGIDFEKGMNVFPLVTVLLIAACTIAFIFELQRNALFNLDELIAIGALNRNKVGQGELWRLVSVMFLHGSFDHLLGNVVMLYILGMAGEHAYGKPQFLFLYVAGGLAGSLLSLTHNETSVGASGAIFGLGGALIVFFIRHRRHLHLRDKRIGFVLLIWAIYQIVLGFLTPGIDNLGHIGGLLGGAVLGLVLQPAILKGRLKVALHPVTITCFVGACLTLLTTAVFFIPRLVN